jgi:hypothetical protein
VPRIALHINSAQDVNAAIKIMCNWEVVAVSGNPSAAFDVIIDTNVPWVRVAFVKYIVA